MIREVIATGRDVSSAIDSGCAELGIDRDNAQFEIISLPRKGFLGLKHYPAKVKVFEELPDLPKPKPAPPKPAVAPKPQQPAPRPAPQQPAGQPAAQQPVKPTQPAPKPAQQAAPKPAPKPQQQPTGAKQEEKRENRREEDTPPQVEIVPTPELREKVERSAVYLAEIMRAMGFETIEVTPAYYSESVCLRLSGAQLGVVIGRRGETLDALQYLTSLVANRGEGDYIRVNIDSGNYREKREKTLTALARKLALQAVRTGKSTTLEPMNPYERRVIHGAVSQIRGAVSTSTGADPNRRVVISPADPARRTGEGAPERGQGGDRGGRGRSDRRDRDSKPSAGSTPPRTPLRPNTNTVESVAAARYAPASDRRAPSPAFTREDDDAPLFTLSEDSISNPEILRSPAPPVRRVDSGSDGHTATFAADRPKPPEASTHKRSDAELFGDIPLGVPVIPSDHPTAPKAPPAPAPRHEPKKIEGTLYGKIEVD